MTQNTQYWTSDQVQALYERIDRDLLAVPQPDRFSPGEGVYRLGEDGSIREADWDAVFKGDQAPAGFKTAYLLIANQDATVEQVAAIPLERWQPELERLSESSALEWVYWTQADENGDC